MKVVKFGGTIMGNPKSLQRAARIVKNEARKGSQVLAVVSAASLTDKDTGVTSKLLQVLAATQQRKPARVNHLLDAVANAHDTLAQHWFQGVEFDPQPTYGLQTRAVRVGPLFSRLKRKCGAACELGVVPPKLDDGIVGLGEQLSAILFQNVLRHEDVPSAVFNPPPGADMNAKFLQHVTTANQPVVVVPGFPGSYTNETSTLDVLGRGYSDYTAGVCASLVPGSSLDVYKDTSGIFTANPTIVQDARLVEHLTPAEAAELTFLGNAALHPRTMNELYSLDVPVRILDIADPYGPHTRIDNDKVPNQEVRAISLQGGMSIVHHRGVRRHTDELNAAFQFLTKDNARVHLGSISQGGASLVVPSDNGTHSIVSCVGEGMARKPGTAARITSALGQAGINLEMIVQGNTENNLSFVVEAADGYKAVRTLHALLF